MSNTVVDPPYHIVPEQMRPDKNTAGIEFDNTDSMFDILKRLYNVGPGLEARCQMLTNVPRIPDTI